MVEAFQTRLRGQLKRFKVLLAGERAVERGVLVRAIARAVLVHEIEIRIL